MFPCQGESVIFIFCYGGPSQVDTFDEKPELYKLDVALIPVETFGRGGHKNIGQGRRPSATFDNPRRAVPRVQAFLYIGGCGRHRIPPRHVRREPDPPRCS
ncbi:MAG: DUF1501 domain-containing protein [Gemmataceae bacterium]